MPATTGVGTVCRVSGRFSAADRDDAPDAGFAGVRLRGALAALVAVTGLDAAGRGLLATFDDVRCVFAGPADALRAAAVLRPAADVGFARVALEALVATFFVAAVVFVARDAPERTDFFTAFFTAGLRTAAFFVTFLATSDFLATADFFATVFFAAVFAAARFFAGSARFFAADFFATTVLLAGRFFAGVAAARLPAAGFVLRTGILAMNGLLQWMDARANRTHRAESALTG